MTSDASDISDCGYETDLFRTCSRCPKRQPPRPERPLTPIRRRPDVVVAGAGAFGAWTALVLQERGLQVTLVDPAGPGNDRSASGGESRNIRAAYGARPFYTAWAIRAWDEWLRREAEWGVPLVFPCGSLRAGSQAELAAQAAAFERLGRKYEIMEGAEAEKRWPQLRLADAGSLFWEPLSGILAARDGLRAVARAFVTAGGEIVAGAVHLSKGETPQPLLDGKPISAGQTVLALGPWLRTLLPDLIGPLLRTPRRELFFMAPMLGDTRFCWQNCPNIVDPLGWTSSDMGNGFKVAPPMPGIDMNPDEDCRLPTTTNRARVSALLRARLPALADRPIMSTYVGMLENTASEDFLIDRHPGNAQLVIAGGGSGHAFKMGPVIGAYVADLVMNANRGSEAARFGLGAHRPLRASEGG